MTSQKPTERSVTAGSPLPIGALLPLLCATSAATIAKASAR